MIFELAKDFADALAAMPTAHVGRRLVISRIYGNIAAFVGFW